jgi:hypothetical protein
VKQFTKQQKRHIKRAYSAGTSVAELRDRTQCDAKRIVRFLESEGIALRTRFEQQSIASKKRGRRPEARILDRRALDLRLAGKTTKEAAAEIGMSDQYVRDACRRLGRADLNKMDYAARAKNPGRSAGAWKLSKEMEAALERAIKRDAAELAKADRIRRARREEMGVAA